MQPKASVSKQDISWIACSGFLTLTSTIIVQTFLKAAASKAIQIIILGRKKNR
jgi:hypothetical protein